MEEEGKAAEILDRVRGETRDRTTGVRRGRAVEMAAGEGGREARGGWEEGRKEKEGKGQLGRFVSRKTHSSTTRITGAIGVSRGRSWYTTRPCREVARRVYASPLENREVRGPSSLLLLLLLPIQKRRERWDSHLPAERALEALPAMDDLAQNILLEGEREEKRRGRGDEGVMVERVKKGKGEKEREQVQIASSDPFSSVELFPTTSTLATTPSLRLLYPLSSLHPLVIMS